MPYLLDVAYLLVLVVASPWLAYQALRKGKYREGFAAKLLGYVPRRAGDRRCLWFHAVSVGEVNLLAPLLAAVRTAHPDWECVVSTTTMTGHALARKKYADLTVFYCPLDFSWATRAAVRRIRPDCLVLAELELWPNLIHAVRAQGARVAVINGRLSERSFRGYRRLGPLVRRIAASLDLVAAQNEEYAARFRALGARSDAVHVTGSIKFDGAQTDRGNPTTERLAALAGFATQDVVFLAGSTQEPEEALAVDAFRRLRTRHPRLRLVIVPRHPDRFAEVAALLDATGISWQRRSQLRPGDPAAVERRVLLVDTIGELGAWWGAAQIAFVGGSLSRRGGQNMIEPAAYGAAVSFGPNTRNFRDVVALMLAAGAAEVVPDGAALERFVERCLAEPEYARGLGERAAALVAGQLGATDRTLKLLATIIDPGRVDAHAGRRAA